MFSAPGFIRVLSVTALCVVTLAGCADNETKAGHCSYPDSGWEPARTVEAPPSSPELNDSMIATFELSQGQITIELTPEQTPCTVNNFASLAEQNYFDMTPCHRLSLGLSLLQCGDPTGEGKGNPGYTIPDELTGSETYGPGTVAMANTGEDDTGGAQFFLVYGTADLPPEYTVFGQMDAQSVAVLKKIAAAGTSSPTGDGSPMKQVFLESVTIA